MRDRRAIQDEWRALPVGCHDLLRIEIVHRPCLQDLVHLSELFGTIQDRVSKLNQPYPCTCVVVRAGGLENGSFEMGMASNNEIHICAYIAQNLITRLIPMRQFEAMVVVAPIY